MLFNRAVSVGSLAVVGAALLLIPASRASAQRAAVNPVRIPAPDPADLVPRRALPKTATEELRIPTAATGQIIVKFRDNVRARVRTGVLNAQGDVGVEPARAVMARFELTAEPLFKWSPRRLANLENRAATVSRKAQPDLAGMIAFEGPWDNLVAAARALNDLPSVEWVSFKQSWRPMLGTAKCCFPDTGVCSDLDPQVCADSGGTPGSAGSSCADGECGPGGCCLADGSCENVFDEEDCLAQGAGSVYQGFGTDCIEDDIDCDAAQCGEVSDLCFTVNPGPACADQDCCQLVCSLLPTCCDVVWEQDCVSLADLFCETPLCPGMPVGNCPDRCASPFNGDCFTPHSTGGCIDATCCQLVCAIDPFCCDPANGGFWDASCVAIADDECGGVPTTGPTPSFEPLQGYLRQSDYDQQAGGVPTGTNPTGGGGWNLRGDNYGLWVINEINVDPDPTVGDANLDGLINSGDQFIEIVNNRDLDLVIGGWTISSSDSFTPDTVRHEIPAGTVISAGRALVVFGTLPPDPAAPVFGGATVQGATVGGAPTGTMGFFVPGTGQTGTVTITDDNGRVAATYTWGTEASKQSAITRKPDVSGPEITAVGEPGLTPLIQCAADGDCASGVCIGEGTGILGACSPGVVSPGTRSDGTAFSFDRYLGLYGTSRELIESFNIGQTTPPGTGNFDDLTFNARGKGINVAVIEWSFYEGHEDLDVIVEPGQTLLPIPENSPDHATACLGIINAQENTFGVTGIAPDAQAWFFPLISVEEGSRDEAAFLSAYETLNAGDVVSCSFGPGDPFWNLNNNPVTWTLMRMGSDLGITTCVAAGNDCENLSQVNNLGDSGAIVVGAGQPSRPWCRLTFSNYFQNGDFNDDGNIVHCQAWGTSVTTTGYGLLFNGDDNPDRSYTSGFNGTSAACPQIAGLAACLQGLSKQFYGIHLGPSNIRAAVASGREQCLILDPQDLPGFPAVVPCGPDTDPDSGPNRIGIYPVPGRGEGSSSWAVLNNSGFDQSPLLDDLVIITGDLVQGNVFSIKGADDNHLIIDSRMANPNGIGGGAHDGGIVTGDTTMFQLIGHMQSPNIESLQLEIEAFVDNGSGIQLIYMYDWIINSWLAVAVQFLGVADTDTATVFPIENGSRFIRAADNQVMLRLQTVALGIGGQHRSFTDWVNISRGLGDAFISSGP